MLTELTTAEARSVQGGDTVANTVIAGAKSVGNNLALLANAVIGVLIGD